MLVAGVDSSTQSTKVLLCEAEDGTVVARGSAPHPPGTECGPAAWWSALEQAGAGLLDRADAIAVAAQQHGMVVVDEAYAEFRRDGTPSALTLLPGRPRLVVTRTMSKAFAAAGTRLGYLAADPAVIDALLLVRLPYHLSTVTQAVARAALARKEEPLATVQALRKDRDELVTWLRGNGLTVADSDANFVLFGVFGDRDAVWQGLLDRGVLIRNTGPAGWLRVTVGTPEETAAFMAALTEVLAL